ncbi:MAG: hypothetical protein KY429_08545 [Actinobacteria bacterium]|nr:hypothetical protein [Actinomycetota bacterium]
MPTEYDAGRFFVRPITTQGVALRLFTDTGGGDFLQQSAATRLGINAESVSFGEKEVQVAAWPDFTADTWIPPISVADDPRAPELKGRLLIRPDDEARLKSDGMLGQAWFGGRTWTFDYPRGQLVFHAEAPEPASSARTSGLGFPTRADGTRSTHFPSIEATIDEATYPFLFDTGATAYLTQPAQQHFGGPARRATCFVTAWLFDQWHLRHPDWPLINGGDENVGGQPMVEVPVVTIAGIEVGPVWFTRRPDRNFHEYMSSMMDRKVEGALGGSLFQYFVITVDYPRAVAHFRVP